MSLLRKYKISKITNIPLLKIEEELINYLNLWLKDLKKFGIKGNPNSVYYMRGDGLVVFLLRTDFNAINFRKKFYNNLSLNTVFNFNQYLQSKKEVDKLLLHFIQTYYPEIFNNDMICLTFDNYDKIEKLYIQQF